MKSPSILFSLIALLSVVLLLPSCSDSPTTAADSPAGTDGTVDPQGETDFLLGATNAGSGGGRVEVWASNLKVEPETVSFDAVLKNASRTDIAGPLYFIITEIRPDVVEASNADDIGPEGPMYDFGDDVGTDGILSAGEASAPVTMVFTWPEPMAFSIGFRVQAGDSVTNGLVSGIVFNDRNGNGVYEPNIEPGIAGVVVNLLPSAREILYRAETNHFGAYVFDGLTPDIYTAKVFSGPNMFPTTPNPLIVALVRLPDGSVTQLEGVNFGFTAPEPPPPPPPVPWPIFGPVDVGPGSFIGTVLDTVFHVPDFFAAVDLFLVVTPPPILGPFPIQIDEATVKINDDTVWNFVCEPDTICTPYARILLDPPPAGWENTIHIETFGDERSFLMYSIEAVTIMPNRD